jgi:two-component sensor histidine kinase
VITELESIEVLIDTAIPCGLIINELVSNSLKHAFPGDREGNLRIILKRAGGDTIELKISDDGVGIPDGFNMDESNTLGYKLFRNIVEGQLMGTIKIETNKGLSYTINFRDMYKERV